MKLIKYLAIYLLVSLCFNSSGQGYQVNDVVSDFKLMNIDSTWFSLSQFDDQRGIIVIFTSNSCKYAEPYEDRIIALNEKFAGQKFPLIAVNSNASKKDNIVKMKEKAVEKGFKFPYLLDKDQLVCNQFGVKHLPTAYVLMKGSLGWTVVYMGAIDDNPEDANAVKNNYVDLAVTALLNYMKPDTKSTPVTGCEVKEAKKK